MTHQPPEKRPEDDIAVLRELTEPDNVIWVGMGTAVRLLLYIEQLEATLADYKLSLDHSDARCAELDEIASTASEIYRESCEQAVEMNAKDAEIARLKGEVAEITRINKINLDRVTIFRERTAKAEAECERREREAFEYAANWGLNASGFLQRHDGVTPQESIQMNIRAQYQAYQSSKQKGSFVTISAEEMREQLGLKEKG